MSRSPFRRSEAAGPSRPTSQRSSRRCLHQEARSRLAGAGQADGDGARLDLDRRTSRTFSRSPPSSSYSTLRFELHLHAPRIRRLTNGDWLACPAAVRASVRAQSDDAVGVHDADLEPAVLGTSHPRTPRRRRTADRRCRRGCSSPCRRTSCAVDEIFALNGFARRFFDPVQT